MDEHPFQQEIATLSPRLKWELQRLEGYITLAMTDHARKLIAQLPPQVRSMDLMRNYELRMHMKQKNWSAAAGIASSLCHDYPGHAEFIVEQAYALRRCESIERAEEVLRDGMKRFPEEAIFPYNLACYAAIKNQRERALLLLRHAFELNQEFRALALDDEDLVDLQFELERV